jgi:hypothetical protein
MRGTTRPVCGVAKIVRTLPAETYKIGQIAHTELGGMHYQHIGHSGDHANCRQIAPGLKTQIREHQWVDRVHANRVEQDRIAIGLAIEHGLRAEVAAAPGLFSTTTGWPSFRDSGMAICRATKSPGPPARTAPPTGSAARAMCLPAMAGKAMQSRYPSEACGD